ncbi:MAG: DUF3618 domain-containing protein [Acidobacteriota bacterium]
MDQTTGVSKAIVNTANAPARIEHEQSIEKIRQDIEQTRNEITDTVDLLGEKLKETFDWRAYLSEYPLIAVGGASLLGFYLARKFLAPKRSNTEELLQSLIRSTIAALQPKRQSIFTTLLTLSGKYVLDRFQQYQEEQQHQQQLQRQWEEYQQLQQHYGGYSGSEPAQRQNVAD